MDHPWIIAHRGASQDCPENTLAAFDEALGQGAEAIELDVQLSRDGVPVVWHDRTVARAGGGRRRVGGLDLVALRRLDPAARLDRRFHGQHIPTLEEVITRYGGRTRLLVEIKVGETPARHSQLASAVAGLVCQRQLEDKVLVLSFDPGVLEVCAEAAPRVGRVLNLKPPRRLSQAIAARLPTLWGVSADVRTLVPSFAEALESARCPLLVYTCNTRPTVERALRCGAVGVMSDRPAWLAATLETVISGHAT